MRILDLFSGIGGFSLGLERAGMKTVAFCEIDKSCRKVLSCHWPDVPIYEDICALKGDQIGPVEIICGGFPCQDISLAGKGAGLEGARSGLWFQFHRLIEEIKPKYAIIENVSALRSRGLDQVLRSLAKIGYDAEWHCIPASAVGAPHRRDRVWIIAYPQRNEQPRQEPCCRSIGRMGREFQSFPWDRNWQSALREFRGVDDGLSYGVDRLNTLRNAVVPQIPEMIGRAIMEFENANP
jgi:DNA (cytosine-5)-methyltransferase 1